MFGPTRYRAVVEPGTLLASGRAADVYDQGDGTVLRRYKQPDDVDREARAMSWLAERGYPVPAVHAASGRDLVMQKLVGPTMLEDFERRPWRLVHHARLLAALQLRLGSLTAPDWLESVDRVPPGDSVLHLDLHPMNVMLTADGPVVIDWTNVSRGAASFDAAMSSVLMSTAELDDRRQRAAVRMFVLSFELARGRRAVRSALGVAAEFRLADPNVTSLERVRLTRLVDRHLDS